MIRLLWIGVAVISLAFSGCGGEVTPEPTPEETQADLDFQKTIESGN